MHIKGLKSRTLLSILVIVLTLYPTFGLCFANGNSEPYVSATAAVLMEWHTGTILYAKNPFLRMHPASVTKMMTALLAVEQGRMEDLVQVSEEAASQIGSSMYLKTGDIFTLQDLLYGLMLNSGNDAAWAIAEHIGGTAPSFMDMMNRRARELGAVNTKYANPHGLTDPNHYTTAFDLCLIAKTCLRHPLFKSLVATKEKDVIEAQDRVQLSLSNTNRLLWTYVGADGVKTGTTQAAGQCLVASATRNDLTLLAVILDSGDRWSDACNMFEYGFSNFRMAKLANAGSILLSLSCPGSLEDSVPLVCATDLWACVPKYDLCLTVEVDVPKRLYGRHDRGEVVGQATINLGSKVVSHTDLITGSPITPKTLTTVLVQLTSSILKFLFEKEVM
jgi:D-alanyl-D-alanine carboxypeptidase (penicillin-binding protein 5/6)